MTEMRYAKSEWAGHLLRQRTPGGAQTLSKMASAFVEGAFPQVLDRGQGSHVWDVDEHEYIDYILGLGAVTLGYCDPVVNAAVREQLTRGVSFSLPTRLEGDVAARLIDIFPHAEMARFVKTGSEACAAAVRIARAVTGRDLVLTCGYHGWHDWTIVTQPSHPGVPDALRGLVKPFPYNDLDAFDQIVAGRWLTPGGEVCESSDHLVWAAGEGIAAVILEPIAWAHPAPDYLAALAARVRALGAVLIFDETLSGFRAPGGSAQWMYNVIPDLTVFGKAIGNGFPLAGVAGPRTLMESGRVISGTYGGEALSLAAASVVLARYRDTPVLDTMARRGLALREGIERVARGLGLPVTTEGLSARFRLVMGEGLDARLALSVLVQELATHGVLMHPAGVNLSAAHTMDDVEQTMAAMRQALAVVADYREDLTLALRGKPYQAPFTRTVEG